jgi:hypothetical protein
MHVGMAWHSVKGSKSLSTELQGLVLSAASQSGGLLDPQLPPIRRESRYPGYTPLAAMVPNSLTSPVNASKIVHVLRPVPREDPSKACNATPAKPAATTTIWPKTLRPKIIAQFEGTATAFVASQTYTWEFENSDKKIDSKDVEVTPKEATTEAKRERDDFRNRRWKRVEGT